MRKYVQTYIHANAHTRYRDRGHNPQCRANAQPMQIKGVPQLHPQAHTGMPYWIRTGILWCIRTGIPHCILTGIPHCIRTGIPCCIPTCARGRCPPTSRASAPRTAPSTSLRCSSWPRGWQTPQCAAGTAATSRIQNPCMPWESRPTMGSHGGKCKPCGW